MCLGLPGRLVERDGDVGVLDVRGRRIAVNLAFTPEAAVGAWLVAHAGMAVRVVPDAEASAVWELVEEVGWDAAQRAPQGPRASPPSPEGAPRQTPTSASRKPVASPPTFGTSKSSAELSLNRTNIA